MTFRWVRFVLCNIFFITKQFQLVRLDSGGVCGRDDIVVVVIDGDGDERLLFGCCSITLREQRNALKRECECKKCHRIAFYFSPEIDDWISFIRIDCLWHVDDEWNRMAMTMSRQHSDGTPVGDSSLWPLWWLRYDLLAEGTAPNGWMSSEKLALAQRAWTSLTNRVLSTDRSYTCGISQ